MQRPENSKSEYMLSNSVPAADALELALTALLAAEKELARTLTGESDQEALNAYLQDYMREHHEKLKALVDSLSQARRGAALVAQPRR